MIESIHNEKIVRYSKLNDKKYRKIEKLFIACGKHLVEEAIKKDIVKEIFLLDGEENVYENNVTYVSLSVMRKLTDLTNPPKVCCVCFIKESFLIDGNVVILDDIKDPGNLGTIIRSAVAFNYKTIILSPNTVDIYNSKTIRSTEGMLFHVNILVSDLTLAINDLKNKGYLIYGTDVTGGKLAKKADSKHAIVIGSEALGLKNDIKAMCDSLLYIPMNKECESLNASISASILMYELGGKD